MDRIKNTVKIFSILVLLAGLVTCKDPTELLNTLEDEVKQANDLYLEIVGIIPDNNAESVDPGADIKIEFDRAINMDLIENYITLTDSEENTFESGYGKSIDYSFNTTNNILTIEAQPYLDGLSDYTLSILDGLSGTDGSQLRDPHTLSFSTRDAPRGTIEIDGDYTNEQTVNVSLSTQGATYYWISTDSDFSSGNWKPITSGTVLDEITFTGDEGEKTIYAKFRDGDIGESATANVSEIENDTIIYDVTPPEISLNAPTVYSNANTTAELDATVTDNFGEDAIDTYLWEEVAETVTVDIDSETSKTTTVNVDSDGNYTLTLTVTDKAGNSTTSSELFYIRDSVAPNISINESITKPITTDFILTVVATDDGSEIASYLWEQKSGDETIPFSSTTVFAPTVSIPTEDSYNVRITVTDIAGNSNYADIVLTGNNSAPVITLSPILYFKTSGIITANLENAGEPPTSLSWERSTDGVNYTSISSTESLTSGTGTSQVSISGSAGVEINYTYRLSVDNGVTTTISTSAVYWDTKAPLVDLGSTTLYANISNTSPTAGSTVTENGSGIQSYSWENSSLTFGTPDSSSTSVSASLDGTYTITLRVTDNAGNEGLDTRTFTRDTVAPDPPIVTAADTNPSSNPTPEYTVTAGSGGISSFQYSINGGSWYTYNGSYVSVPYGGSTVSFRGRDAAGNWSSSVSKTTIIYPTKTIIYPLDGATGVRSGEDIAWQWVSGYYYEFYMGAGLYRPTLIGGYRYYSFVDSSELSLSSYTTYNWYVKVYTRSGLYPKYIYTLYSTSPTYSFTTGFTGIK